MNNDEKKRWLKRYRSSVKKIEAYRIQIEALEVAANGGAIKYSDLPKAKHFKNIIEDKAIDAAELIGKIDEEIEKQKEILVEIVSAINTLDDPEEHIIMSMRYVECLSWEQIEKIAHRSDDIFRIHRKALDNIKIPMLRIMQVNIS